MSTPSVLNHDLRVTPISELVPHPSNARKHDDAALDESLAVNGFYKPVLASTATGRILAGHGTVDRAKAAGMAELPVYWLHGLSLTDELRILASDNRTSDLSPGYDEVALAAMLDSIKAEAGDLEGTGFDAAGYDEILASIEAANPTPVTEDEPPPPDRAAELQAKWKTERGQIWTIPSLTVKGKAHRLMCGDSTDKADVERLMGGEKADMLFTDPPYGISIVRNGSIGGGESFGKGNNCFDSVVKAGVYAPIIGDDTIETALAAFAICASLKIKTIILWGGNFFAHKLPPASCWIVWDKETDGNFGDGEIAWCSAERSIRIFRHKWSGMLKASERGQSRVHPTQKPIALAAWCFNEFGKPGDLVLDLFVGSGSTLVACEQTGRTSLGMELSPDYVAVILERLSLLGLTPALAPPSEPAPVAAPADPAPPPSDVAVEQEPSRKPPSVAKVNAKKKKKRPKK